MKKYLLGTTFIGQLLFRQLLLRHNLSLLVSCCSVTIFFHWSVVVPSPAVPSQSAWPGSDPHLAASHAYIKNR